MDFLGDYLSRCLCFHVVNVTLLGHHVLLNFEPQTLLPVLALSGSVDGGIELVHLKEHSGGLNHKYD